MRSPSDRGKRLSPGTQADKSLRRALDQHRAGNRQEAERLYTDLLQREPAHFDAAYLLALSMVERGRIEAALPFLATALKLRPADPAAWRLQGIASARLGRNQEALTAFDAALAARPASAELHVDRGTALQALGRPVEALAAFDSALTHDAGFVEAYNNRGNALSALGRDAEALASYDVAIVCAPNRPESHNNRGNALRALQRSGAAVESFDRALALAPDYAAAHTNRGSALRQLGRIADSLAAHEAAVAANPGFAPAQHNRATTLIDLGRLDEALEACDAAQRLSLDEPSIAATRGTILKQLGRYTEALEAFAAAGPDHVESLVDRGLLLVERGQVQAGCTAIERALARAPRHTRAFYSLTQCRRFRPDDPLLAPMQALAATASLPIRDRIDLHFGLGKALSDVGQHDAAFGHLAAGNRLQRGRTPYDEAATLANLAALRHGVFPPAEPASTMPSGPRAIFILGMPRSGSTLVEQVLAGHPDVAAAGETDLLTRVLRDQGPMGLQMASTGLFVAGDGCDVLRRAGEAYRAALAALAPSAGAVTNKLPDNFRMVGLIRSMLPDAVVIHTRRHPLDTCLSCFATRFTGHQPFSFDLAELGRYYRAYAATMAHWREALPAGAMLEIDYEQLVEDFETTARRMIDHCCLSWDAACLDFPEAQRPVFTASFGQVREGLNRRSMQRWLAYAKHLAPLREAMASP
ncbi:sulfotransferase [Lichenihabitans sp. Uapishka_5]|uniref:tetratricopeptide repeat-containing sulfotransferase family protein n=1 Tax=Lichenihabitans sp. Uapishka_5 TaxID=3037302 RepID=UPI0029E7E517|nr:sulfotransferase [Lichenihabitans sp. Uapishka_5]MDX7949616.1 sulfotransferase [Lichenihabitans sp. Uapishka_5]